MSSSESTSSAVRAAEPHPGADAGAADGLSPAAVMRLAAGARHAQLLYTAVRLDLFTRLEGAPAGVEDVARSLGLRAEGVRDFLYALDGLGLVERLDEAYRNTPVASAYLVRNSAAYIGGFVEFCETVLDPAFARLGDALRTGRPAGRDAAAPRPPAPGGGEPDPYTAHYRDDGARDTFLAAMDTLSRPLAVLLAKAVDWSRHADVVDVGGARGDLAAHLLRSHPHLTTAVFDLPEVLPAFEAHQAALGTDGGVAFVAGDFFHDPLPVADALIFGHVLHNWSVERRIHLLRSAHRALRPGGAVYIYDPLIDPAAPRLPAVLSSLNMRVWSAGGSEYTAAEAVEWLSAVGFARIAVRPLGPNDGLLSAVKER